MTRVLWFNFGFIATNQDLLGVFSPIMFLPAPLFYLAVRNISFGVDVFRKKDLLHFLPALISAIDLIPFYLMPSIEKQDVLDKIMVSYSDVYVHIVGFIPSFYIHLIRLVLIIVYFTIALNLILKSDSIRELKNIEYKYWLKSSLIFLFTLKSLVIIFSISTLFVRVYNQEIPKVQGVLFGLFLVVVSTYVLKNYLKLDLARTAQKTPQKKRSFPVISKLMGIENKVRATNHNSNSDLNEKLKVLFESDQIFLLKDITTISLAGLIGVNSRALPTLLNDVYGCNFKELVNRFRIDYAVLKIEENFLDLQTIEALSDACGYNSRITFFNAFKKEKGYSPNEYWKRFQEGVGRE
ncbi:helix-turn-helix domain-containing protein [Belliella buryatensis]|uniref:helix-turn-helix domain-containing protein n=1 Tax=Belliella buryatensis TaxID=1500549 RepID=UPI001481E76A|nr:AraC family transcriptional regulator [Belliella buryatensis]